MPTSESIKDVINIELPSFEVPLHTTNESDVDEDALKAEIKSLLSAQNAVLVAHYYTDESIQALAEESGG